MNDIATRAGVSQTTVSFVLNGRSNGFKITEETRQRVLETARAMGYRRNELARAMVTGKTRVLGLLTYDASAEHIAAMLAGALDAAATNGYSTKVLHLPFDGNREEQIEILHRCSSWRLDGTMAISLKEESLELVSAEMKNTDCPVVYVENVPAGERAIHVEFDACSGIRAAVEHLVNLGHRYIAFMTGPEERAISQLRNQNFLQVTSEFENVGLKSSVIKSHWSSQAVIQKSLVELLDVPDRASAVICAGDAAAMLTMREARRRGLSVPADLSVIGFGNFNLSLYADPALTTIGQPFREMGQVAMNRLLESIEADGNATSSTPSNERLPTSLVIRDSTAPPYHTATPYH